MNAHPTPQIDTATPKPAKSLPDQRPSSWGRSILIGLGAARKSVYPGSVPPETVARRRAANRTARKSRRTNRGQR